MRRGRTLLLGTLMLALVGSLVGCTNNFQSQAPKALFALRPAEGEAPLAVSFDGTPSFSENGSVTEYLWDFGDGNVDAGPVVSHTYESGGTFQVVLQVFNEQGRSDKRAYEVVVHHRQPTAEFDYTPSRPGTGERVWFDASGSDSPNGEIVEYRWDFGDGNSSDEGAEVMHQYWSARTYNVSLTIIDEAGQTDKITKRVEIRGGEPCSIL